MLKLSWEQLNAKPFIAAIMTLNNNQKLDNVTAYRVGRIVEVARRELSKAHEIEIKRATELGTKDEKGEVVFEEVPGGKRPKLTADADAILSKEMQKLFQEKHCEIAVSKLDFNALNGLNGEQLVAIADICDNLPE